LNNPDLKAKLESRQAVIAVLGLGYVGLPLALMFSEKGYPVLGFDVDAGKVEALAEGISYIREIPPQRIVSALARGFIPTCDGAALAQADAFIICVPTPLHHDKTPMMDYVVDTCRTVAPALGAGKLVSLESTVYPGATRGEVAAALEVSGLRAGGDFHLVHSPERIDPGSGYPTEEIPKLVAGINADSLQAGLVLYGLVFNQVVPVPRLEVAEAAKLYENIYRAVNIALANEIRTICHVLGIDPWAVIDAASTKPYGFSPFYPGPGIGGHCIPLDPHYLAWRAQQEGMAARFIELAAQVNEAVPAQLMLFTEAALEQRGQSLNGANILVLGVAYKRDVDDMRESPAIDLIELLIKQGAHVTYHDPFIPRIRGLRQTELELESLPLTAEVLRSQQAIIITTDHNCIDYAWVAASAPLLIDPRGVTRRLGISGDNILVW
jgi:UDP-N-acetyl-D-glucosamine dehydrogenase